MQPELSPFAFPGAPARTVPQYVAPGAPPHTPKPKPKKQPKGVVTPAAPLAAAPRQPKGSAPVDLSATRADGRRVYVPNGVRYCFAYQTNACAEPCSRAEAHGCELCGATTATTATSSGTGSNEMSPWAPEERLQRMRWQILL